MNMQELADLLERRRNEQMLSVREFAHKLGFSALTYQRIVAGVSVTLRATTLRRVQREFGIPSSALSHLMRKP